MLFLTKPISNLKEFVAFQNFSRRKDNEKFSDNSFQRFFKKNLALKVNKTLTDKKKMSKNMRMFLILKTGYFYQVLVHFEKKYKNIVSMSKSNTLTLELVNLEQRLPWQLYLSQPLPKQSYALPPIFDAV